MSDRRWVKFVRHSESSIYIDADQDELTDAEVLAELGAHTDTATFSDWHLAWIIEVPGPGRYRIIKEDNE